MQPWAWLEHLRSQSPFSVTHFLQRSHIYCNKVTPPNSSTPYESMGPVFFQTITELDGKREREEIPENCEPTHGWCAGVLSGISQVESAIHLLALLSLPSSPSPSHPSPAHSPDWPRPPMYHSLDPGLVSRTFTGLKRELGLYQISVKPNEGFQSAIWTCFSLFPSGKPAAVWKASPRQGKQSNAQPLPSPVRCLGPTLFLSPNVSHAIV